MANSKEKKEEIIWDKKKIILFLIVITLLIGVGFELKTMLLGSDLSPKTNSVAESVKGTSAENLPNVKRGIQNQINTLTTEAQNINVVDIATSSPQVQKVINDLKALQDLPQNQIKSTCEKICNGL